MNSSSNSRLPTPKTSQNIFLPSDTVNLSMDSCFINLTFYNEPIDDIFKEFFSIGQAETQGMPGILDSSFNQKPWDVPFKAYEQENGKDIFSDMSDPNTYLERMEIQKQYEIYNIFLMKYSQGMSEPQITDHIAKNYPSHQNIKVTGVRYVLRCKQPS
ncbi:hypothetical protein OnM2_042078 [Erysiphe neolycopersici]|uniref:Uncharacterized protein n=1 Tax=Erysiphe neolycopersici TaxID=212602 RepID=A0A420HVJ0_9PEZI|nr:hypothetical protein OnM2_042078 [Erysiphe neolycopersici]